MNLLMSVMHLMVKSNKKHSGIPMILKHHLLAMTLYFSVTASFAFDSALPVSDQASTTNAVDLYTFRWHSGAKKCESDSAPELQVVSAQKDSYVIRQNKCTTFEAPFMFLLIGTSSALLVDTGALESEKESPVYKTIAGLLAKNANVAMPLTVIHTHSHSDHTNGDSQFIGKSHVSLTGKYQRDLEEQLGFENWPNDQIDIDLGGRIVTIIPIPGHQDQSIAIYDSATQWLLTGDTLYPGSIRVKNWGEFKDSIQRLSDFSKTKPVSSILGSHIEMNGKTSKIYSIGTVYQPDELPLALPVEALTELNLRLQSTKKSKKIRFSSFEISPFSYFEKLIIKAMTPKPPKPQK